MTCENPIVKPVLEMSFAALVPAVSTDTEGCEVARTSHGCAGFLSPTSAKGAKQNPNSHGPHRLTAYAQRTQTARRNVRSVRRTGGCS